MTPEAIIAEVKKDGVHLALSPAGTIKARGDEAAVNRWLPIIQEHKPGIVAALRSAEHVALEPAHQNARLVYWERADGRIYGPARPEFLAQVGTGSAARFWVVVSYGGQPVWILSDRLRSRQAFEQQIPPTDVSAVVPRPATATVPVSQAPVDTLGLFDHTPQKKTP